MIHPRRFLMPSLLLALSAPGVASAADATVTCRGANAIPMSDASGQLTVDLTTASGTLSFQGWPGMPSAPQTLSCRQVPGTADAQIFCATADHAYAASIYGTGATIFVGNAPAPGAWFSCTSSGTLPPSAPSDLAKIRVGRYVPAIGEPSLPAPECQFADQLVLDRTEIGTAYVVSLVHEPGAYCTPLDIAKKPDASFTVVGATQEPCDLLIKAVDASGRTLEIRDDRQALPPKDPAGPSCAPGFGDLSVATAIPGIQSSWSQQSGR